MTGNAPPQVIPEVALIYKQLPNGARQITGIEIGGQRFGGIVSVDTGVDLTEPSTLPASVVRLKFETLWPFEWRDESRADVLVATRMPPL
jgi:hypothetical protein